MTYIRKTGKRGKYWFACRNPLSMDCFAPGRFESRGATLSGSHNTGHFELCCMNNAYRGCPIAMIEKDALAKERKKEGWKKI
jgi:hypothetical protein